MWKKKWQTHELKQQQKKKKKLNNLFLKIAKKKTTRFQFHVIHQSNSKRFYFYANWNNKKKKKKKRKEKTLVLDVHVKKIIYFSKNVSIFFTFVFRKKKRTEKLIHSISRLEWMLRSQLSSFWVVKVCGTGWFENRILFNVKVSKESVWKRRKFIFFFFWWWWCGPFHWSVRFLCVKNKK